MPSHVLHRLEVLIRDLVGLGEQKLVQGLGTGREPVIPSTIRHRSSVPRLRSPTLPGHNCASGLGATLD